MLHVDLPRSGEDDSDSRQLAVTHLNSYLKTNVKAPLKNPVRRSSRREEAQIVKGSAINQSLVALAATKIANIVACSGEID